MPWDMTGIDKGWHKYQSNLRFQHILLVDGLNNRYRVNDSVSGFDFDGEQHS
jgi:hypothetical protein